MFDYSSCANFLPGTACEVSCKAPYVGSVRRLACPSSNTEMDFIPPGDAPHCELVCPDPIPFTTGYRLPGQESANRGDRSSIENIGNNWKQVGPASPFLF